MIIFEIHVFLNKKRVNIFLDSPVVCLLLPYLVTWLYKLRLKIYRLPDRKCQFVFPLMPTLFATNPRLIFSLHHARLP